MALVSASLAADLKTIFDAMDQAPTTNTWLANQIAAAIDKQIKTATVATPEPEPPQARWQAAPAFLS